MRTPRLCLIRLSTAVTLALIVMLVGCGGDSGGGAAGSGSGTTVEGMLDQWAGGDKEGAFETLLAMDWSDPPLAEDSLLTVSNTQLAKEGNISKGAELGQRAHEEYFKDWMALGQHALKQLDKARTAGDDARAKQIKTSLDAMCAFLKKPEHVGIFQRLGTAVEPLAPGEIQTPLGF